MTAPHQKGGSQQGHPDGAAAQHAPSGSATDPLKLHLAIWSQVVQHRRSLGPDDYCPTVTLLVSDLEGIVNALRWADQQLHPTPPFNPETEVEEWWARDRLDNDDR
jgi:hypothetical protein